MYHIPLSYFKHIPMFRFGAGEIHLSRAWIESTGDVVPGQQPAPMSWVVPQQL